MFQHAITAFRVRGIPIRLHVTLLIFVPYVAFVSALQYDQLAAAFDIPRSAFLLPPIVWGLVIAIGLLASIVLHELAHSFVAVRMGLRVRSITLMMLGGVSNIDDDVNPEHEAWMAFAGPLMSFCLALVGYALYRWLPIPAAIRLSLLVFSMTNLILALFNLLPAFPMDGGRVLRGLLATRIGPDRATRAATSVGKVTAIVFALLGIWSFNLILVLIAWFVYTAASAEETRQKLKDTLRGIPVSRVMSNGVHGAMPADSPTTAGLPDRAAVAQDLPKVHEHDDAAQSVDVLIRGDRGAAIVLDDHEHVVGMLTLSDIERAVSGAAGSPGPGR